MTEDNAFRNAEAEVHDLDELESVVVRERPFAALSRAAGSSPALSLAALITATATILTMAVASDIASAKFYNSRGFNNLAELRWVAGARLIVAGVAIFLTLLASAHYARELPAVRYTFSTDGEEVIESTVGSPAPAWTTMLLGAAFVVSVLALVLNAIAFAFALHLHESPNFGIPTG